MVIWDEWADASLEERSSVTCVPMSKPKGKRPAKRSARQRSDGAGGDGGRDASLPDYHRPAASDPVKPEEVNAAMLEQGASELNKEDGLQLRFATKEEAEACLKRLSEKLPGSEPIWIISRDIHVYDHLTLTDSVMRK